MQEKGVPYNMMLLDEQQLPDWWVYCCRHGCHDCHASLGKHRSTAHVVLHLHWAPQPAIEMPRATI